MAEVYPSDNELLNITGETETGVEYEVVVGIRSAWVECRVFLVSSPMQAVIGIGKVPVIDERGKTPTQMGGRCLFAVDEAETLDPVSCAEFSACRVSVVGFDKDAISKALSL